MTITFLNPSNAPKPAGDEFLPLPRPSMSVIYVKGLFRPDIKVEIEALAAVD